MNRELRIVYMGTPEFAVGPLRAIIDAGYNVIAVITATDKPAGRGQKIQYSPVKEYALKHDLKIMQPSNLKNPDFVEELKNLHANLQVVVAFRMLPEMVWRMPEFGTLNLHASLLPQYRGAAPINHAIINGETETGLTTFFIEKEIDTGDIILSKTLSIEPSDNAGTLHDKLRAAGCALMLETLDLIRQGKEKGQSQITINDEKTILYPAPKIFKKDCKINWNTSCIQIHNLVRGLSPFPCAFSTLISKDGTGKQVKIFKTSYLVKETRETPGDISTDNKNTLSVYAIDGIIQIEELQMEGKKRMTVPEFLRGITISSDFRFE
ncbi:MAG: methionyl-tRNA formyltransferase [Bacteroidota bacterium]